MSWLIYKPETLATRDLEHRERHLLLMLPKRIVMYQSIT